MPRKKKIKSTENHPFTLTNRNGAVTISAPTFVDCEWCFQFDDGEPFVFATSSKSITEPYIQFKLKNTETSNIVFRDDKNNKKFKLFARKKHEN